MRPRILLPLLPLAFALTQLAGCATSELISGYKMRPQQIDEIKGVYELDNGTTLRISSMQRTLYAEFGQRRKAVMVPIAEGRFVVPDLHMTMEYRPDSFGDQLVLTYPANLNAASGEMVTARLPLR